ncbi:MAG: hypothetical protein IPP74_07505 [Alphaproteobacteria bacterium]|nr:hypothetical protein [Alphaproteobacteria bacterium]
MFKVKNRQEESSAILAVGFNHQAIESVLCQKLNEQIEKLPGNLGDKRYAIIRIILGKIQSKIAGLSLQPKDFSKTIKQMSKDVISTMCDSGDMMLCSNDRDPLTSFFTSVLLYNDGMNRGDYEQKDFQKQLCKMVYKLCIEREYGDKIAAFKKAVSSPQYQVDIISKISKALVFASDQKYSLDNNPEAENNIRSLLSDGEGLPLFSEDYMPLVVDIFRQVQENKDVRPFFTSMLKGHDQVMLLHAPDASINNAVYGFMALSFNVKQVRWDDIAKGVFTLKEKHLANPHMMRSKLNEIGDQYSKTFGLYLKLWVRNLKDADLPLVVNKLNSIFRMLDFSNPQALSRWKNDNHLYIPLFLKMCLENVTKDIHLNTAMEAIAYADRIYSMVEAKSRRDYKEEPYHTIYRLVREYRKYEKHQPRMQEQSSFSPRIVSESNDSVAIDADANNHDVRMESANKTQSKGRNRASLKRTAMKNVKVSGSNESNLSVSISPLGDSPNRLGITKPSSIQIALTPYTSAAERIPSSLRLPLEQAIASKTFEIELLVKVKKILSTRPRAASKMLDALDRAIQDGKPFELDFRIKKQDVKHTLNQFCQQVAHLINTGKPYAWLSSALQFENKFLTLRSNIKKDIAGEGLRNKHDNKTTEALIESLLEGDKILGSLEVQEVQNQIAGDVRAKIRKQKNGEEKKSSKSAAAKEDELDEVSIENQVRSKMETIYFEAKNYLFDLYKGNIGGFLKDNHYCVNNTEGTLDTDDIGLSFNAFKISDAIDTSAVACNNEQARQLGDAFYANIKDIPYFSDYLLIRTILSVRNLYKEQALTEARGLLANHYDKKDNYLELGVCGCTLGLLWGRYVDCLNPELDYSTQEFKEIYKVIKMSMDDYLNTYVREPARTIAAEQVRVLYHAVSHYFVCSKTKDDLHGNFPQLKATIKQVEANFKENSERQLKRLSIKCAWERGYSFETFDKLVHSELKNNTAIGIYQDSVAVTNRVRRGHLLVQCFIVSESEDEKEAVLNLFRLGLDEGIIDVTIQDKKLKNVKQFAQEKEETRLVNVLDDIERKKNATLQEVRTSYTTTSNVENLDLLVDAILSGDFASRNEYRKTASLGNGNTDARVAFLVNCIHLYHTKKANIQDVKRDLIDVLRKGLSGGIFSYEAKNARGKLIREEVNEMGLTDVEPLFFVSRNTVTQRRNTIIEGQSVTPHAIEFPLTYNANVLASRKLVSESPAKKQDERTRTARHSSKNNASIQGDTVGNQKRADLPALDGLGGNPPYVDHNPVDEKPQETASSTPVQSSVEMGGRNEVNHFPSSTASSKKEEIVYDISEVSSSSSLNYSSIEASSRGKKADQQGSQNGHKKRLEKQHEHRSSKKESEERSLVQPPLDSTIVDSINDSLSLTLFTRFLNQSSAIDSLEIGGLHPVPQGCLSVQDFDLMNTQLYIKNKVMTSILCYYYRDHKKHNTEYFKERSNYFLNALCSSVKCETVEHVRNYSKELKNYEYNKGRFAYMDIRKYKRIEEKLLKIIVGGAKQQCHKNGGIKLDFLKDWMDWLAKRFVQNRGAYQRSKKERDLLPQRGPDKLNRRDERYISFSSQDPHFSNRITSDKGVKSASR